MKLIVGLGNPGKKYKNTRHNVGFRILDHLSLHLDAGLPVANEKFNAEIAEARVNGDRVIMAKPLTFMNLSGAAVNDLARFYKIEPTDILIIHDEMDYPVGRLAFAARGGDAGHNGVASVIGSLGTDAFCRLRIGIDRPKPPVKKEDYVLMPFEKDELPNMELAEERAVEAAYDWIKSGIDKAMGTWNAV
ncbi:aminoacyl-tRNA hydrolase [Candidatus Uhrbacteria bacterium]|nr:MAG: aminoacyl-tRNA hydrolase [Candidatus Uhrbacteria bacterium]